jgi:hypothetical protein
VVPQGLLGPAARNDQTSKEANHVKVHAILAAVFILLTLTAGCTSTEAPVQVDSSKLEKTLITSHMEEKITPGRNLIYCLTFQIAWNELKDNIIKEDIRLTDEPPIVPFLNKSLSTKADISEDCYVAMAGFGKDGILEKINKALKAKFGADAPVVEEQLGPDWIFAYAFLYKNLEFKQEFECLEKSIAFPFNGGVKKVKAFGIKEYDSDSKRHQKIARQVSILHYNFFSEHPDFVIRLKSASPDDEIILARVEPEETLAKTLAGVQRQIENAEPDTLDYDDTLQIPQFDFDLKHSYSELCNKHFKNKGFKGYFILKAIQSIRFKLSEKGVLLKSEARIPVPCEPKRLIFDRPFLIYLKEKGAKYPYFAMWVGNAELLVKE